MGDLFVAASLVAAIAAGCMTTGGPGQSFSAGRSREFGDKLARELAGTRWLPMFVMVDGRPKVELIVPRVPSPYGADFGTVYIRDDVPTVDAEDLCDVVVRVAHAAPPTYINELYVNRESNHADLGWVCGSTG